MGSKYNGNTEFYQKAAVEKLTLKDVFSDVFKKHSRADGERLFTAGTAVTTPAPSQMLSSWVKPWVFVWVLGFGLLAVAMLMVMDSQGYGKFALIPMVFLGAFIMPLAVLIFYFEMNIPRNIPAYEVLSMLLIGGVLSLIFTGLFKEFLDPGTPAYLAPLTEEPAKLLALCVFLRKPGRRYILNGVVIGGAVGAGFAAIETTGYFMDYGLSNLLVRGLLAPGGHVLWAAIYGGALAMVVGQGKLQLRHFTNLGFLKYFGISCLLHFIWNSNLHTVRIPVFGDATQLILTVAGWVVLLHVLNKGIQQVLVVSAGAPGAVQTAPHLTTPIGTLVGVSGQYAGQSLPLSGGQISIGRDPATCNLLFSAEVAGISRRHCTITSDSTGVYLCDNGSTYGTFLDDGTRLQTGLRVHLRPGQRFYLVDSGTMFELRR